MIKAFKVIWKQFTKSGVVRPKKHILGHEALKEFKAAIQEHCTVQIIPQENERTHVT